MEQWGYLFKRKYFWTIFLAKKFTYLSSERVCDAAWGIIKLAIRYFLFFLIIFPGVCFALQRKFVFIFNNSKSFVHCEVFWFAIFSRCSILLKDFFSVFARSISFCKSEIVKGLRSSHANVVENKRSKGIWCISQPRAAGKRLWDASDLLRSWVLQDSFLVRYNYGYCIPGIALWKKDMFILWEKYL